MSRAKAIRNAVNVLVEAEDGLTDDLALLLERLAATSALVAGENLPVEAEELSRGKLVDAGDGLGRATSTSHAEPSEGR